MAGSGRKADSPEVIPADLCDPTGVPADAKTPRHPTKVAVPRRPRKEVEVEVEVEKGEVLLVLELPEGLVERAWTCLYRGNYPEDKDLQGLDPEAWSALALALTDLFQEKRQSPLH